MPNRVIKDSIKTSRNVNSLSDFQFRLWIHLIVSADDYGRGNADPELIKNLAFPRRKGVTEKQLSDALHVLANIGMVNLYEVDGEPFFYFPKWGEHQRIRQKVSKFPEPEDGNIICGGLRQIAADCGELPQVAAECCNVRPESRSENPEARIQNPEARKGHAPTLEEVKAYCKERNSTVDPVQFWTYFNEGGWRDSKGNQVRNWKQKILTWEKYDTPKKPSQITASCDFSKRDVGALLDQMEEIG